MVALDADSDNDLDVLIANELSGGHELSLRRNDGAANFGPAEVIRSAASPVVLRQLELGDFDKDTRPDVALVTNGIQVLRTNGDGSFTDFYADATLSAARDLAVADFNGDTYPDLAVTVDTNGTDPVYIYLNNTDGSGFTRSSFELLQAGSQPTDIAVGQFSADLNLDLAITDQASDDVTILLGDGSGNFIIGPVLALTEPNPTSLAAGDLNADGVDDIAVAFSNEPVINILAGAGAGAFDPAISRSLRATLSQKTIEIADYDGDSLNDIALGTSGTDGLTLFYGQSGVGFYLSTPQPYTEPAAVYGFASGDFNDDGRLDLVVPDYNSDEFYFYAGNQARSPATPTLSVCAPQGTWHAAQRTVWRQRLLALRSPPGGSGLLTTQNESYAYLTNSRFTTTSSGGQVVQDFYAGYYGGVGQSVPDALGFGGDFYLNVSSGRSDGIEYRFGPYWCRLRHSSKRRPTTPSPAPTRSALTPTPVSAKPWCLQSSTVTIPMATTSASVI